MSKQHLSPNIAVSLLQVRSICLHVRALTSSSTCLYKITSTERSPLHRITLRRWLLFPFKLKKCYFNFDMFNLYEKFLLEGLQLVRSLMSNTSVRNHQPISGNMSNLKMAVIYLICAVFKTRNTGSPFFSQSRCRLHNTLEFQVVFHCDFR